MDKSVDSRIQLTEAKGMHGYGLTLVYRKWCLLLLQMMLIAVTNDVYCCYKWCLLLLQMMSVAVANDVDCCYKWCLLLLQMILLLLQMMSVAVTNDVWWWWADVVSLLLDHAATRRIALKAVLLLFKLKCNKICSNCFDLSRDLYSRLDSSNHVVKWLVASVYEQWLSLWPIASASSFMRGMSNLSASS